MTETAVGDNIEAAKQDKKPKNYRRCKMKVLLILVDGMRPDALVNVEKAQKFIKKSAYAGHAQTVMPSVTLPCHVSLFHSVGPERHGTTTNTYAPQVRPVRGLCEVLRSAGKNCAFFYNWEELRDLSRPGSLCCSDYLSGSIYGYDKTNDMLTDDAIEFLKNNDVDFTFLYLGFTDAAGHSYGWLSKEYYDSLENSWSNIERITDTLSDEYTVIVTADHGGHGRCHGCDIEEDMTIPIVLKGKDFKAGTKIEKANIMDIAPTVAKLFETEADPEWEGHSLL